jgi:DNA repair exonuclease SbcCD ATPase subunit
MKIKKARGKNFFSIGNAFLEIEIDKYKRTLLKGKNGHGKSTIANMITFGIFGKVIKKVKKELIVNSVNRKNCVVEIEFESKGHQFLVRRGIKPNVFEIFKDGELVDQSLVGDYQEYLETEVCSFRTFLQTCVLTSENYTPFMSLDAASRRAFVEDILDIRVFSVMDKLTKAEAKKTNDQITGVSTQISTIRGKIELLQSAIQKIDTIVEDNSRELLEERTAAQERLERAQGAAVEAGKGNTLFAEKRAAIDEKQSKKSALKSEALKLKTEVGALKETISFFTDNDNCPTCHQPIEEHNVGPIVKENQDSYNSKMKKLRELARELAGFDGVQDELDDLNSQIMEFNTRVATANAEVSSATSALRTIDRKLEEIKKSTNQKTNSDDERAQLKVLVGEAKCLGEQLTQLRVEADYNKLMLELFKDSGIKSKIVDQYIPVINTLVNQYLDKMELFISFELDSEFNETLKSRHRDGFTYHNFSMGEKQRIDLAIMFTWRRLAAMRNSFDCNVFIADEVFDAAVDTEGVSCIADILNDGEFDQTNLFIVSHRNTDQFEDLCDGRYLLQKVGNFSEAVENPD